MTSRRPVKDNPTRDRIVSSAARLMQQKGVKPTTVDAVLRAAGAGKGQFYYYFDSKKELVREVLDLQLRRLLSSQQAHLEDLDSWGGIRRWFDGLIEEFAGPGGRIAACPLGTLAAELAGTYPELRPALVGAFDRWSSFLQTGLERMVERGELSDSPSAKELATTVLAMLEGGILLSRTYKDISILERSLEGAIVYLQGFSLSAASDSARR